jgi:hypothetical protein
MTASGRGIFRSAVLGFTITAAFVSYQLLSDPQSPIGRNLGVMLTFVILCPPSLLSIPLIDVEVGTNGFYIVWIVIGMLNAALYAGIRVLLSTRLQRHL